MYSCCPSSSVSSLIVPRSVSSLMSGSVWWLMIVFVALLWSGLSCNKSSSSRYPRVMMVWLFPLVVFFVRR